MTDPTINPMIAEQWVSVLLRAFARPLVAACGALLFSGVCFPATAQTRETFTFGTNTEDNVFTGQFERLVYQEAFRRLGVPLKIMVAPLKRLELSVERGEIDGEMVRGPAYGTQHPALVKLGVPLMQVVFAVYAMKPIPGLYSLNDLQSRPIRAVYSRGVLLCESKLSPFVPESRLSEVADLNQGLDMLAVDHADVYCEVSSAILNERYGSRRRDVERLQKLFDISSQVDLSGYVLAKHAALATRLTATLQQMEKEGLLEKYKRETLARLTVTTDAQGK